MIWREILKIILDAILFSENKIAVRGSNEIIEDPNSDLIEFASHYNTTLKEHIKKHKKGPVSYFSPTIQREIIKLAGDKTRNKIICRNKKAKFRTKFSGSTKFGRRNGYKKGFLNKRKRRGKIMEIDKTPEEGSNLTPEELFKIQIYGVLNTLLSQIDWRYQKMKTICDDFCFLYGSSLQYMSVDDLKQSAAVTKTKNEQKLASGVHEVEQLGQEGSLLDNPNELRAYIQRSLNLSSKRTRGNAKLSQEEKVLVDIEMDELVNE
ncbi:hypothetical protein ILUMI_25445 [Ignelater luminosus]|uniref:Uncharacterized protein n=1 Tax=Ignelater luminosus TaxID=2038154 RepID=A0A8K0FZN4_IGNLU|nr:hypothetical protein ILUMI_25445 [Ignelater luminosus]